ncbi:hypothetical protein [Paracoccus sp. (in: a-proteobacteria)]|uniref:hypothetical protein n=1 Tax=Paracoccus sp. TaxID=267 RepID=UPI00322010BB
MTQMIVRYRFGDQARFRAAFDADAEDRGNNGLGLLQLWREGGDCAWALFSVHDARAARVWLEGAAAVFHSLAGVTETEFHLVETV